MSFVIQQPLVVATTTEIDVPPSADLIDCIGIEIINDTSFAYNIILPGGKQSYMAPQTIKYFAGTDWYGDYTKIFPISVMSGNYSGLPQKLIIIGYRNGEQFPVDGYVQNINKTAVIGNAVTVANMNILQNDGAGAGTTIIETTVAGQVASNQTATNDGVWNLGIIIGGVITPFFVSKTTGSILQLGTSGKTVEVMGALQVDGSLSVANLSVTNLNVSGTQSTTGSATFSNVIASGTLGVSGATTLASNVNVGGTFSTTGSTVLNSTLTVSGLTTLSNTNVSGTLSTTGVVTAASHLNVGGTFSTTGAATFASNENVGGTFSTTGVATFASHVNVGGTATITGVATLASNANVGGTFSTTGAATLASNATVGGTFTVTGSATLQSNTAVNGNLTLTGSKSNKITGTNLGNNIVQGSLFNGSSSSTTANQTFNHNFDSGNGNPLVAFMIDITGTQPAMQFTIVTITASQITFKASATGSFTGFALRA